MTERGDAQEIVAIHGEAVRILRRLREIRQIDFARRLGISEAYLRYIESGGRSLLRNQPLIYRIAAELDVPVEMISLRP